MTLNGKRVILNAILTKSGEPYEVRRTWKERLFTRPWRPLKATRTMVPQVPSREVIVTSDAIYMHPALWAEVERGIKVRVDVTAEVRRQDPYSWTFGTYNSGLDIHHKSSALGGIDWKKCI